MISALLMWRRFLAAVRYARREENFGAVAGAALALVAIGTVAYTLGNGWNLVDGFYFAVSTLTTTSVADPELVLDDGWLKLFTAFYILIGLGILVELIRRLGSAFIAIQREAREKPSAG